MSTENVTCASTAGNAISLDEHLKYVQRFLLDMYQTMIDPIEEFDGNIQQLCELLLKQAHEDREALRHRAAERRVVDAAVAWREAAYKENSWTAKVIKLDEAVAALIEEQKEKQSGKH